MYHPTSIASLSEAQITKALKGLPVRVSAGNQHDIELSKEQFKKFAKANQKGKAMNITLDPFQIQSHMRLIGSGTGGNIKAVAKDAGKRLIVSGTDRAIRAIDGSGVGGSVNRLKKGQRWEQFANATIRDAIDTTGKASSVYYDSSNPMAQMGFGLKKRGRPRKRGGALYPAGVY